MLLSGCPKLFVFDCLVYLRGWLHSTGVGCTKSWVNGKRQGWEGEEEKVPRGEGEQQKREGAERRGEERRGEERRGEERRACRGEKSWMQMGIYSLRTRRQDGNEWASVTSISVDTHTHTHTYTHTSSETLPSSSSPMLIHASLQTAAVPQITAINISTHKQTHPNQKQTWNIYAHTTQTRRTESHLWPADDVKPSFRQ